MDTEKRKFGKKKIYTKWLQTAPAKLFFPPVSMSPSGGGGSCIRYIVHLFLR